MSDMAGSPHAAPTGAGLTYEDLVNLPEDGKRYEILDGDLVVTASPITRHQRVLRKLFSALDHWVQGQDLGELFFAPIDVLLDRYAIVVPDLLVEILSPSTAERDRDTKARLYARFGVDHYWIVDADSEELQVYIRDGASYRAPAVYRGRAIAYAPPFPEFALDLRLVWE